MPRLSIRLAAAAAICVVPFLGFAQVRGAPTASSPAPSATYPQSTAPSTTDTMAPTGTHANTNATATSLKSGMIVKDSTGATIGKISKLANDTATIKMSKGSFTAPAANLTVENGAATINMTKADIDAQVKGGSKKTPG
ncbi:MAG TPA: hypothetical protein VGI30_06050 [Caulobacteraceae bacterium]|jgi:hypothetical protein